MSVSWVQLVDLSFLQEEAGRTELLRARYETTNDMTWIKHIFTVSCQLCDWICHVCRMWMYLYCRWKVSNNDWWLMTDVMSLQWKRVWWDDELLGDENLGFCQWMRIAIEYSEYVWPYNYDQLRLVVNSCCCSPIDREVWAIYSWFDQMYTTFHVKQTRRLNIPRSYFCSCSFDNWFMDFKTFFLWVNFISMHLFACRMNYLNTENL